MEEHLRGLTAVDLFCGAGGLTYGLEEAGIPVTAGIDIDTKCKYPYEKNTKANFKPWDISDIDSAELDFLYPDQGTQVLVGCAPCQPFSQFTQGRDTTEDEKWSLLSDFAAHVDAIIPSIVSMENVPELEKHSVFTDFVKKLTQQGYSVWYDTVHAPQYRVPQDRRRLVLLASTLGDIQLEAPSITDSDEYPTVADSIRYLPPIEAGETYEKDAFHRSAGLRKTNLERIRSSKPGGTWRDWPDRLKLRCHRRDSGNSYVGVYGRMEWDEPAPTITTQFYNYGSGRFGHPKQDRAISFREGALLQTFPESYRFRPDGERLPNETAGRMIGNAVPVELAKAIGRSIKAHLQDHDLYNATAAAD